MKTNIKKTIISKKATEILDELKENIENYDDKNWEKEIEIDDDIITINHFQNPENFMETFIQHQISNGEVKHDWDLTF